VTMFLFCPVGRGVLRRRGRSRPSSQASEVPSLPCSASGEGRLGAVLRLWPPVQTQLTTPVFGSARRLAAMFRRLSSGKLLNVGVEARAAQTFSPSHPGQT
jgi:hypothetical protein